MSKNLFVKLFGALVVVAAAVLWLLSELMPESFGWFNLAWACVMAAGGLGLMFLLQGIFQKNITTIKKFKIWIGVGLIIVAFVALVSALVIPENIVLPIIAIILAAGLVITLLATGGKKWDEGDNQQVGYKNYHQRKAEEEKQNEQNK
ncbi:MAG: hypothetical protein IJZ26_03540 [Clostridia bacterium]|nr:hypothetical protein [Clostridia bacterium]